MRRMKAYGFKNVCELMVALARVFIDRTSEPCERQYDLPDEDGQYIDSMFNELSHTERTPDGDVPVAKHNKTLNDYGEK